MNFRGLGEGSVQLEDGIPSRALENEGGMFTGCWDAEGTSRTVDS